MRPTTLISLGLIVILAAGCGKDNTVKELRQLRSESQFTAARDRCIDALQENPANMDLWQEFARASADLTRASEREGGEQTWLYLVEGSLVCGGVYKLKNQNPSRDWRDACRLMSSEVTKQANKLQTTMMAQASSAEYLSQLLEMQRGDVGQSGARASAAQMVDEYRGNARTLLFRAVLIRRLLEMLPEISSGAGTMLISQLESAQDEWRRNLELTANLTTPIQERANRAVDTAFGRVMGDLETLGYIIPGTILENGILE